MTTVELLDVVRASRFITYTLENDLQVQIHRRTALSFLSGAICRRGDRDVVEFPAEKFDKIMTFLSQNDQQVHYASAQNTVGVYAIVRLVADLRRMLRDYERRGYEPDIGSGPAMMTPREHRQPVPPQGRVPGIDLTGIGAGRDRGAPSQSEEGEH